MKRHKNWILSSNAFSISSLSSISKSLIDSCRQYDQDIRIVELNQTSSNSSDLDLFLHETPEVIFVAHPLVIHHSLFRQMLLSAQSSKVKFIIYVVGDFLRRGLEYIELEHLMMGKDIHWVFPSESYANVARPMFENPQEVSAQAIALDRRFGFDEKKRKSARESLGLKDNELCFIYTGRISRQKNIELSIELIKKSCQQNGIQYKFLLVGTIDDFEGASVGLPEKLGSMFYRLKKWEDENVVWVPEKNSEQLAALYNGADIFVSLSCYHDESFGLSPLEALGSGLPCLLSRWGGYRDFQKVSDKYCQLIKIELSANGFEIDEMDFFHSIKKCQEAMGARQECSKLFRDHYSHDSFQRFIQDTVLKVKNSFQGFSAKYRGAILKNLKEEKKLSEEFEEAYHYKFPIRKWNKETYEEIYGQMWREGKDE